MKSLFSAIRFLTILPLEIMKDSRIGAMGLLAIIFALAIKCAGIVNTENNRFLLLVIIPAYSRGPSFFGFRFLTYGRPGGGLEHDFFSGKLKISSCLALAVPAALSIFAGSAAAALNIAFITMTAGIIIYYKDILHFTNSINIGNQKEQRKSG